MIQLQQLRRGERQQQENWKKETNNTTCGNLSPIKRHHISISSKAHMLRPDNAELWQNHWIIYETNECIKNKSGAAMKEKWTFFSQHKVFPDRWHLIKVTLLPHTHSEAVYRSRAAAIQQMSPCNPHCNTYMWKWNHLYCSHMKRRVKNQFSSDLCFSNSEVWTFDFCILFVLITVSGWFWSQRNL